MSHIFISYSRRDVEIVDRIVGSLSHAALKVWIDREDIQAGNSWRLQIVQAIDTCDAFVLMLSPNAVASENIRKEIDLAQDSGRKVFPVMLEPVKLPAEIRYQLAGLQFIDVQMLGLEKAISQLTATVKDHVAKLKPVEEQKACQAEVVIQGIDLSAFSAEKREELLNFVAQITNTSRSGLAIANTAAGSVHVFIDMPTGSAYELKTLALNRDRRFKKLGITSLRLAGDSKFINISLGIFTAAATIGFLQSLWLSVPSLLVPVVGVTIGKALTISLAVTVIAGLALSAPNVIAPLLSPPSTPTQTLIISTPVPTSTHTSALTSTPIEALTLTVTPLATATPQNPLVLNDIVCWVGPGPNYEVAGALKKDTRVELIGRAKGWWIVDHPRFHIDCWVMEQDLQIDPDMDTTNLPIISPPVFPTRTPRPEPVRPTPTCDVEDPACYTPFPSTY